MPFLYCRKSNKENIGNSGYPVMANGLEMLEKDVVTNFGGVPNDYAYYELSNEELKELYKKANYELIFDSQNIPIGVKSYDWAIINCPEAAIVGEIIDISVSADKGEGKETILYIDGLEYGRGVMPINWEVQFETVGIYKIMVDTGEHGEIVKEVIVE